MKINDFLPVLTYMDSECLIRVSKENEKRVNDAMKFPKDVDMALNDYRKQVLENTLKKEPN